eukprot:3339894-Prymnesium_polylepis.1
MPLRRAPLRVATQEARCARLFCSKSDAIRGATPLMTPTQRDAAESRSSEAARRVQAYRARQEQAAAPASSDAATVKIRDAAAARIARMREDNDLEDTFGFTGGGGITNPALEARFRQMEREGEFKDLKGAGKPLPERPSTHFNDDPMQGILNGMLANANYKPDSLELRAEYLEKLGKFRADLTSVVSKPAGLDGRRRQEFERRLADLREINRRFERAALKDAVEMNLPARSLPAVLDLDAELRALSS